MTVSRKEVREMGYSIAVFDLDGTITDSGTGIMKAIRYAVGKKKLAEPSEKVLRSFIGPPLREQFQSVFGLDESESREMVDLYRVYYEDRGIFENRVYDGVPEMLETLKNKGVTVLMATSKPEKYAKVIVEHFGLMRYFDFIGGACMDGTRTAKDEVIGYVVKACRISEEEKKQAVMIGDRRHDILGAKKNGLHSMGVLYGYGSREELEEAGAEEIVRLPSDICALFV